MQVNTCISQNGGPAGSSGAGGAMVPRRADGRSLLQQALATQAGALEAADTR
jgi:hypothetical protein